MSLNRLFARRLGRATLALCAAAVVSACGGGDRAEPYVPTRLVAFGDELSLLVDNDDGIVVTATNPVTGAATSSSRGNGVKYTINGFNGATSDASSGVLNCAVNPIWVQTLAADLGMAFKQCAGAYTTFAAETRASVGARTDTVVGQMRTLRTTAPVPTSSTLVTVQVGMYDVIAAAQQVRDGTSLAEATTAIEALATRLTDEVRSYTVAGIGILVATIPDVSYSPFAATSGLDTAVMHKLTWAFNEKIRTTFPLDGHQAVLVSGTPYGFSTGTSNTGDYTVWSGYTNARNCTAGNDTPSCTTSTLVDSGAINTYIWADDLHPAPITHTQMGNAAYTRVRNTLAPGL
jgi:phospholipase/lecithinase/hemolysin